jgi:hypothetical protein
MAEAKVLDDAAAKEAAEQSERALGRRVAIGLPALTAVGALAVALFASVGSALLVLAAGVLIGTIALLWASVRTLSGDAPLPEDLEALAARAHDVDALAERKNMLLRALKDMEHERAIGRVDAADYEAITADYRAQVKEIMKEMDADVAPRRARAEAIAKEFLAKKDLRTKDAEPPPPAKADGDRVRCATCGTSNEADAAFCKKCGAKQQPVEGPDA